MDKKVITFFNIEIENSNFDRVCRYDVIHASSMGYFSEKSYNKFMLQRRQLWN